MKVSDAVKQRKCIRAFVDTPVENGLIKSLLEKSARAASGGNLQPWRIFIINNETMTSFLEHLAAWNSPETPSYDVYPKNLTEPYRSSRYKVAMDMYELLKINMEDKEARMKQLLKNFEFFGAPAAFFCYVDRQMGPPQWSDLGMFLQTFMLLAKEEGLDTCPQEAWATRPESVSNFVEANEELMLFCGMAIGYIDTEAPVNQLVTEREPIEVWAKFVEK
jgi:nitroreductase|tara:strand:- start:33 stop:692 length:660 start_codon:yes stop_codon:yes gene_type:complete